MHESDFHAAMRADLGDDLVRLAYADWLDERADARADFVRLSVEASKLHPLDAEYLLLHALAESQLRRVVRGRSDGAGPLSRTAHYRGLPLYHLSGERIIEDAASLPTDALGVQLESIRGRGSLLYRHPQFTSLAALTLHQNKGRISDFEVLLSSRQMENLASLSVYHQAAHRNLLGSVLAGRHPQLTRLRMTRNFTLGHEYREFANSELLREQLTHLCLGDTNLEGLVEFFRTPVRAERLRRLEVVDDLQVWGGSSVGSRDVLSKWALPTLEEFSAPDFPLSPNRLAKLCERMPNLKALSVRIDNWNGQPLRIPESVRRLSLNLIYSRNGIGGLGESLTAGALDQLTALELNFDRGQAEPLPELSALPQLSSLMITGGMLGRRSFERLVDRGVLSNLRRLDLRGTLLRDIDSVPTGGDHLPSLEHLTLEGQQLSPGESRAALALLARPTLKMYVGDRLRELLAATGTRDEMLAAVVTGGVMRGELEYDRDRLPNVEFLQVPRFPDDEELAEWSDPGVGLLWDVGNLTRRGTQADPFYF